MGNVYNTGDTAVEASQSVDNTFADGVDIAVGSTTGTKIATATTQKLGFYNATPVVQPAGTVDVLASLVTLGLRAASSNPPLDLTTGLIRGGGVGVGAAASTGLITLSGDQTGGTCYINLINTAASGGTWRLGETNAVGQLSFRQIGGSSNFIFSLLKDGGCTFHTAGAITLADAMTFVGGTSTGTKIMTAANQKLGFYNATPVAQQTGVAVTAGGIHAALVSLGLITA